MSYLVNLDVRGRPVLVVGAGAVAARKSRRSSTPGRA